MALHSMLQSAVGALSADALLTKSRVTNGARAPSLLEHNQEIPSRQVVHLPDTAFFARLVSF